MKWRLDEASASKAVTLIFSISKRKIREPDFSQATRYDKTPCTKNHNMLTGIRLDMSSLELTSRNLNSHNPHHPPWLAKATLSLQLLLLISLLLVLLFCAKPRPVVATATSWSGSDFAFVIDGLQSYWDGVIPEPYSYGSTLKFMATKYGYEGQRVMFIAYSPVALVVLRPIPFLAEQLGLSSAHLWNLISIVALGLSLAVWTIAQRDTGNAVIWLIAVGLLISDATTVGVLYAQTSLIGAAGLLTILYKEVFLKHTSILFEIIWYCAILILSIKITYLAAALLIVFAFRPADLFKSFLPIVVVLLISTISIPPVNWIDWVWSVSYYVASERSQYLSAGIIWALRNSFNLRVALTLFFEQETARSISTGIFLTSLIGLPLAMLFMHRSKRIRKLHSVIFAMAALSVILCLSSYVGRHEELLLIPLVLLARETLQDRFSPLATIGVLLAAFPAFATGFSGFSVPMLATIKTAGVLTLLLTSIISLNYVKTDLSEVGH